MRFVILTDTHFVARGTTLYAQDPASRLRAALAVIRRDHPDALFIVITGDLAHWGEHAAYESLRDVLADAPLPVHLMLGNHDKRRPFRDVFPDADNDGFGHVQAVRVFGSFSMITLDTLDEDGPTHAGLLCDARLGFLEDALKQVPADRPVLLFQHHPPFDTGLPHMDRIKLRTGAEELAVFARTRRPDYLFMGHIHRPLAGTWHGIAFHIQRALMHQVAFDLRSESRIPGTHEQPDYALVTIREGTIVVHQCSFLYNGPWFWLDDPAAQTASGMKP